MRRICMLGLVGCFGVAALPQAAVAQIAPNPAIFSVSGHVTFVQLDGIGSQCNNGRIIVTWDNAGSGDLATNGVMPGYTPSVPYPSATCTVDGMVSQDSGPPISVS